MRAVLGPEPTDDGEVSILNRIVRWSEDCLLYEADPRHVEKLLRDMGMEDCKPLTVPGVKAVTSTIALDSPERAVGATLHLRDPSSEEDRVWNLQAEIEYIKSEMEQPLSKDLRIFLNNTVGDAKEAFGVSTTPW